MPGLIAIVGRPNVGKSALFNRIAGRRIAIVHDQPGVTRDRVSAEVEWHGHPFTIVDTGGIGLLKGEKSDDAIARAALDQVQIAIEAADAIILVADAREGLVALDREVALRLRASGKPVLVAANKLDDARSDVNAAEFSALGFGRVFAVSAIHDRGVAALMSTALTHLPKPDPASAPGALAKPAFKIAIVGRPNVGKSSLVNALTQSKRVIVSPIPGTTRDSIDVPFEVETEGHRQRYVLIDTAGIRKQRRVDNSIEFFSVKRAEESIDRSDLVVFVLDAQSGILEQDKKVADKIVEARKACILVVNKWDLFEAAVLEAQEREAKKRQTSDTKDYGKPRKRTTLGEFGEWVQKTMFFLDYAPVIFTSAQSGYHLDRLLESIRYVSAQLQQKIPTSIVNRTIQDAIERHPPSSAKGLHLKFFYATQVGQAPPTFLLFLNHPELLTTQYSKYLTDKFRKAFGFEGCPVILAPRARTRTIEPVRRHAAQAAQQPQRRTRRPHGQPRKPRPSRPQRPQRSNRRPR